MDLKIISIVSDYINEIDYKYKPIDSATLSSFALLGFFCSHEIFIRTMIDINDNSVNDNSLQIMNSLIIGIINEL